MKELRFPDVYRHEECALKLQEMFDNLPEAESRRWLAAMLGHSSWDSLLAKPGADHFDEELDLDLLAARRDFQYHTLQQLAGIGLEEALLIVNALRPSAYGQPLTVGEKEDSASLAFQRMVMDMDEIPVFIPTDAIDGLLHYYQDET